MGNVSYAEILETFHSWGYKPRSKINPKHAKHMIKNIHPRWEDRSHLASHNKAPHGLVGAYVSDEYSVQRFVKLTDVGFVDHLMVRRHDGEPIHSWSDMQRIKNELTEDGKKRVGVQVFPKEEELVDQANMYHIWVYPKGYDLPFNLKHTPDGEDE